MGVGRGFAHRITRVPLFTIRSSSTSASGLGWVNIGPGVECTAWMQRAGVAKTARTTVGQGVMIRSTPSASELAHVG